MQATNQVPVAMPFECQADGSGVVTVWRTEELKKHRGTKRESLRLFWKPCDPALAALFFQHRTFKAAQLRSTGSSHEYGPV